MRGCSFGAGHMWPRPAACGAHAFSGTGHAPSALTPAGAPPLRLLLVLPTPHSRAQPRGAHIAARPLAPLLRRCRAAARASLSWPPRPVSRGGLPPAGGLGEGLGIMLPPSAVAASRCACRPRGQLLGGSSVAPPRWGGLPPHSPPGPGGHGPPLGGPSYPRAPLACWGCPPAGGRGQCVQPRASLFCFSS